MKGRESVFCVSLIAFILLTASAGYVYSAETVTNSKALPTFLENYLEYSAEQHNLTSAQVDHVRTIWANQLAKNQARIVSTHGAVLNYVGKGVSMQETSSLDSEYGSYLTTYLRNETFGGGGVYDPTYILGLSDYTCTRFWTPYESGGASVVGQMLNHARGDVYVAAKLGPTGAGQNGNYILVYGSNDPNASLMQWFAGFIGYGLVTSPNDWWYCPYVYIGSTTSEYSYVTVGCCSMGGSCTYNDVMGDCVWFTSGHYWLEISSGSGGYTNPSGGQDCDPGSDVQITATPANQNFIFDHWLLDGQEYTQNPITVTMDSDHNLQAFFAQIGPTVYHSVTFNAYNYVWNDELNPNVWVDGNWVGTAPFTISLAEGSHTVLFDDVVPDQSNYAYFSYISSSYGAFGNDASIPIYSDGTITATYYVY